MIVHNRYETSMFESILEHQEIVGIFLIYPSPMLSVRLPNRAAPVVSRFIKNLPDLLPVAYWQP